MPERQKILIVDDKEENLFALEKTLRETEAEIVKATSGDEALAATLHHDFALAILDVHMPGMSGFELADHLRKDEKTLSLPIIFLTATFLDEGHVFQGYEAGAVDYIIKPSNPVILNGKVKAFLELARYRKRLEDMVAERTQKLQHLNQILRKLRNVNQLIVREEDERRLIREACKLLVEARGFRGAWMAVVDGSENLVDIAQEGFGEGGALFADCWRSGSFPPCCKQAREQRGIIVMQNLDTSCSECPLGSDYGGSDAMVTVLEHEGVIRGFMGLAIPPGMAEDEEEQSLFQEVAGDIAYALHNIQLSKEGQAAAEALRASEIRYRRLFEAAKDGILILDGDTAEIRDVNPFLIELLGYSREELLEKKLWDIGLFGDVGSSRAMFGELKSKQYVRYEDLPLQRRGGEVWDVEFVSNVYLVDGNKVIQCNIRDITERRKAEKALLESEQRYRAVFNVASLGIDLVDRNGRFLEVNSALSEFLGYPAEELRHLKISDVTHPDDVAESRELHKAIVQEATDEYRLEKRYIRKDGAVRWGDTAVSAIRDAHGEHRATVGVIADITERKNAEEQLVKSEAQLSNALDIAHLGHWQYDVTKDLFTFNDHLYKIFRTNVEQVGGYTMSSADYARRFVHPDDMAAVGDEIRKAIETTDPHFTGHVEHRILYADGEIGHISVRHFIVKDDGGRTVKTYGVNQDITERKKAEQERAALGEQLLQAQKMESVGTLAGGVAHDFNNILQVALGYSELMLGEEELPGRYRTDIKKINESARRGADLVRRLLTFSRKTEIDLQPLNLNQRVKEMRKMVERTIPKMIETKLVLAENLARVNADPTQIDQILMNLAVNARDAMPEGGELTFETAEVFLDLEYARTNIEASPGYYVLLTVTDTGSGMDKETLKHIFEPFYTTKGVGEGTGLGLAMVHGIVKQHGGHIKCYSEPGHGTTFKIYFPALVSDEEAEETKVTQLPRGGSETILLVDDEELIRDLGARILTKAGYKVIKASNGKEALDVYRLRSNEISLVILDLKMPEMGGKQCLEGLLALAPSLKVVIASGYSANGPTKDALSAGAKGFVNKPYDIRQLLGVVREVLDALR